MSLLEGMGYSRVVHYAGGLKGWQDQGGVLEQELSVSDAAGSPALHARAGFLRRTPLDWLSELGFARLLQVWAGVIVFFGTLYWALEGVGGASLASATGVPDGRWEAWLQGLYFSFVTALSVGYGDVVPVAWFRALAVLEGCAGLFIFGMLISRLVSRRQDVLLEETHRIAFEDRVGRVRTSLHLVLVELQAVSTLGADPKGLARNLHGRVESVLAVLAGELRTVHDLLHRPQMQPGEEALGSILTGLAAVLVELGDLVQAVPPDVGRTPELQELLVRIRAHALDICSECVPREYQPQLARRMDRVRDLAAALGLPGALST